MEKVNNNFDERLKQYSEEIKSMEIVYQNGRVKYINKKNMINLKKNILIYIKRSYKEYTEILNSKQ